jgi:glycosyltransferase involved in cell wall biosynthesis
VLYLSASAQATDAGGRTRILSEICAVQERGVRVLLVSLVPSQQLLRGAIRASGRRLQKDSDVEIRFIPFSPLRRIRGIRRIGDRLVARQVGRLCRRFGAHVVHAHGLRASVIALAVRSRHPHLRVVADMHGISPEEVEYATGDPRSRRRLDAEERRVLETSNWLIHVSDRMTRHYREKYGVARSEVSVVPCATDSSFVLSSGRRAGVRAALRLEGATVFCYLGTYRRYQLIEDTFQIFRRIVERLPEARLLVITPDRDRIAEALAGCDVRPDWYRMLTLPHDRVLETLEAADLGFLLRADSPVNHVASPTKFAEYCIAGVPVVTTPHVGDFSEAVRRFDLGMVVDPERESVDDLVEFARGVVARREEYAVRCHDYAREHLSWSTFGPVLGDVYASLVPGSGTP